MTVIAFDGRYVAADKQATNHGHASRTTKLFAVGPTAVAFTGDPSMGLALLQWWRSPDRSLAEFPHKGIKVSDDQGATMVIFERGKHIRVFEGMPVPITIEDDIYGVGCGRDAAMGAMLAGADAKRAVEIACKVDIHCGMGVDVIDLWSLPSEPDPGLSEQTPTGGRALDVQASGVDLRQAGS